MSLFIDKAWAPAAAALSTAARDIARGAGILGRGAVGLVGMSTLAAVLLLLGSDQVRERVVASAVSATGFVISGSSSADDDLRADADAPVQRWSDWLAARPVGAAEPAQEHVTRYLARRYRVAEDAVRQIVGQAFSTGRALGVDPLLILAVTAIESSLNPFAQSPLGAQGLMQIMTHVHSDKFAAHGGDHAALDPIANLKVGSEILRDLIRRGGSVERGLQLYVGAGNMPDDGGYATRVLGEMGRIKLAASGGVREALAASLRAAAPAAQGAVMPVGGLLPGAAPADSAADRRDI
jgi:soluble lytic murein transglycosylase-like protein